MRRFQVTSLTPPVVMSKDATHHMLDVLRIRPNERFVVFDGKGRECEATLRGLEHGLAVVTLLSAPRETPSQRRIHVLIGMPKHASMDRALRMATETGATDVHPFVAHRSTAKGERAKRWATITRSATEQCGRSDTVRVHPLATLQSHINSLPPNTHRHIALPSAQHMLCPQDRHGRAIVVGPEGGLTEREVGLCLDAGFVPVGLGSYTMRTETAVAIATNWLAQ